MQTRASLAATAAAGIVLLTVAGCTSGSGGDSTPTATATDTVTATATDTVSSAAPPTGSGVPASSTAPAGQSGGNASGPGLCTPTVMTFAIGTSERAAGTGYTAIVATNASQSPCVTTGWPGVALLDASGRQLAQADRAGSEGQTLTVAPGEKIHAVLSSSDVPGEGATTCTAATAILFTLPDNTDSTRIQGVPITVCNPQVQSFQRGTS